MGHWWNFSTRLEFGANGAKDLFLARTMSLGHWWPEINKIIYFGLLRFFEFLPGPWTPWVGIGILTCLALGLFWFIGRRIDKFLGWFLLVTGFWSYGLIKNAFVLNWERVWFILLVLILYILGRWQEKKRVDSWLLAVVFAAASVVWREKIGSVGMFLTGEQMLGFVIWLLIGSMLIFLAKQEKTTPVFYLFCIIWLFIVGLLPAEKFFWSLPVIIFWAGWSGWMFWKELSNYKFLKYLFIAWFGFWILQNKESVFTKNNGLEVVKTANLIAEHVSGNVRLYADYELRDLSWMVAYVLDQKGRLGENGAPVLIYKSGEKIMAGKYDLSIGLGGVEEITKEKILETGEN